MSIDRVDFKSQEEHAKSKTAKDNQRVLDVIGAIG